MAQEAKAPSTHKGHHPPGTMAPKGSKAAAAVEATEAKAEAKAAAAAAKAAAAEEKKAVAALAKAGAEEEAALKKAAARVGITTDRVCKRAADGRPRASWYAPPDGSQEESTNKKRIIIPAYAPQMDTQVDDGTQVEGTQVDGISDTQDIAPLTDLATIVLGDDEPLQATATGADNGEDGQQPESPEQQSPATPSTPATPATPSTQEACPPLSPPHHTNLQI